MGELDFEKLLPRLVTTYEEGRLVPFIGAGLSAPVCRGWEGLVKGLEEEAGIAAPADASAGARRTPTEELVRRANTAVRRLRSRAPGALPGQVRRALYTATKPPPQASALARLWWPLVVSTNYDDCFATAFAERQSERQLDVLGRGSVDCQRVLSSLGEPSRALLWAVQGYAGGPCRPETEFVGAQRLAELESQLVVGHEEYRRVTYRELHFRRAFAEVYRSRSLFFLGSGIRESYLQELFGEILETYGPSLRPHYALMIREEADSGFVQFMRSRFQTIVLPYDAHEELPRMLGRLASWIDGSSRRVVRWTFGSPRSRRKEDLANVDELEVVRGPLPHQRAEGECLAVSAGGEGATWAFGRSIFEELLPAWGVDPRREAPEPISRYVAVFRAQHVFAVRARSERDERGLQHIYRASRELFREAGKLGYGRVLMQLLATGGRETRAEDTQLEAWRARTFPERFSFIQIVRAFSDWLEGARKGELCLAIHLVAPTVYREIASGRLDVLELLSCRDTRFWAEVQAGAELLERRIFQLDPNTPLREVVDELDLPRDGWQVEVLPAPNLLDPSAQDRALEHLLDTALYRLGIVPGSTLRFLAPIP